MVPRRTRIALVCIVLSIWTAIDEVGIIVTKPHTTHHTTARCKHSLYELGKAFVTVIANFNLKQKLKMQLTEGYANKTIFFIQVSRT